MLTSTVSSHDNIKTLTEDEFELVIQNHAKNVGITYWESGDYIGLIFGTLVGLGYIADYWLPLCFDAGFEMIASAFILYEMYQRSSGYKWYESVPATMPDIAQLGV